jgi:hypothetical protein
MTIVNSAQRVFPGFGTLSNYTTAQNVALSGATTTTAVTVGTQGYTCGQVRVKVYGGGSSTTTATISVTVTDGTNTYLIGSIPAYAIGNGANSGVDVTFFVDVDIQIATVNIITALTVGTTTATLDYEVMLNP